MCLATWSSREWPISGCLELSVTGKLVIRRCGLSSPVETIAATELAVESSVGVKLADSISVERAFRIDAVSQFGSIATTVKVEGLFDMGGNTFIVEMPDKLEVGTYLDVKGTVFDRFGPETILPRSVSTHDSVVEYSFMVDANKRVVGIGDMVAVGSWPKYDLYGHRIEIVEPEKVVLGILVCRAPGGWLVLMLTPHRRRHHLVPLRVDQFVHARVRTAPLPFYDKTTRDDYQPERFRRQDRDDADAGWMDMEDADVNWTHPQRDRS
jgi:hypothetical protein